MKRIIFVTGIVLGLLTGLTKGAVVFPQVALGGAPGEGQFKSRLHVSSTMDEETHWTVRLFPTGHSEYESSRWAAPWYYNGQEVPDRRGFSFTLPSRGSQTFDLTGGSDVTVGWMLIENTAHPETGRRYSVNSLAVSLFLQWGEGGVLIGSTGMATSRVSGEQIAIPIIRGTRNHGRQELFAALEGEVSVKVDTGVAWLVSGVPQWMDVYVVFTLFDENGKEIDRSSLRVDTGNTHLARFAHEIFPDIPEEFVGTLRISISDYVDDPLRPTQEEWDALQARLDRSSVRIGGAAIRLDLVELDQDGEKTPILLHLGSAPVTVGLARYRPLPAEE